MAEDILIIGGGHNGLVCAGYLARAGLKVRVLEKNAQVGGPASTEEFHPGFRNSVGAYAVSLLHPKIIGELELRQHGLILVERKVNNVFLHENEDFLAFPRERAQLQAEVARFSPRDAEQLPRFFRDMDLVCGLVREVLLEPPPNAGGGPREVLRTLLLGRRLHRLGVDDSRLVLDMLSLSVAEFLEQYFEHDRVRAAFAFDGIVGSYGDTRQAGSAYVLIHHAFGEVNGKQGLWGHAIGGMGAITGAMAAFAGSRGVRIETGSPVRRVVVEQGRVRGVESQGGETLEARCVVSNLNPSLLFGQLVEAPHLPAAFRRRMGHYKNGSGVLRMNLALSGLPEFTALQKQPRANGEHLAPYLTSGIIIGPTMAYLDQAFHDARQFGWSRQPIIELLIPSTLDDTLAPPGQHVASLYCHQFDPELDWDAKKEQAVQTVLGQVEKFAPGFNELILGSQVLTPLDLERKFGLVKGDIFHGRLSPEQMFSARPLLGYGNYRAPIPGLYMCGSGCHPGGGVSGVPGHNAAGEILKDRKKIFG